MPGAIEPLGGAAAGGAGSPPAAQSAMRRLLDSAEHFLACRDRVRAQAPWAESAAEPRTLAEAIARDFSGFDLERAEADFRAALAALSNGPPPHGA